MHQVGHHSTPINLMHKLTRSFKENILKSQGRGLMNRGLPWSAQSVGSGSVPQMSKPWVTSETAPSAGTSTLTPSVSVTTRMQ